MSEQEQWETLIEIEKTVAKLRARMESSKSQRRDIQDTAEELQGDVEWMLLILRQGL